MVRVGNPPGIAPLLAWYTIAAHQIGGALLIVGFLTPWAALGQVPITAGGLFLFRRDRKSTRLNSSHGYISYAVFCLKKKNKHLRNPTPISTQRQQLATSLKPPRD